MIIALVIGIHNWLLFHGVPKKLETELPELEISERPVLGVRMSGPLERARLTNQDLEFRTAEKLKKK